MSFASDIINWCDAIRSLPKEKEDFYEKPLAPNEAERGEGSAMWANKLVA